MIRYDYSQIVSGFKTGKQIDIKSGQLGMRFGNQNLSQISIKFVTKYRNQFINMRVNLNVILSQIFTKFVTKKRIIKYAKC